METYSEPLPEDGDLEIGEGVEEVGYILLCSL